MPTSDPHEARRTAVALVRADLQGDHAAWMDLLEGTDDVTELVAALSSYAARVTEIIGDATETSPIDTLGVFALYLCANGDGRDRRPPGA
jgi:hypothetical protein